MEENKLSAVLYSNKCKRSRNTVPLRFLCDHIAEFEQANLICTVKTEKRVRAVSSVLKAYYNVLK